MFENGRGFDIPPNCGYDKHFKYCVKLHTAGLPGSVIDWMCKNIKKKWGWFWDQDGSNHVTVSFEDDEELMWFALCYNFTGDKIGK